MRVITGWRDKELKCFFCGTTESVKYEDDMRNGESLGLPESRRTHKCTEKKCKNFLN